MKTLPIKGEYIELGQALKLLSFVSTGGEAKAFLYAHVVKVNKEKEERRGRKLFPKDIVDISGETFLIESAH